MKRMDFLKNNAAWLIGFLLFCTCSHAQVSLQTGSANYSIPIFSWKDHKSNLNDGVSLNYSSGNGLKVNEVATNVGQGWALSAGGVITRMQVGEPDDQVPNGSNSEFDLNKYPPGYLYTPAAIAAPNGCPLPLSRYPLYKNKDILYAQHNAVAADRQLDYFSFQFNGKAGMFVLTANGDKGVMLGDSKVKIAFQRGSMTGVRTSIVSFTIQDVDGLIYTFAQLGLTKVTKTEFSDASLNYQQSTPKFKLNHVYHQAEFDVVTQNPYIVGSWHLTSIHDPLTGRDVTLSYGTRNMDNKAGQDITFQQEGGYAIIAHKRSITVTPYLSSITYPDGHSVNLTYKTSDRFDMKGDRALDYIDITYKGRYISKYILNTTYFIGNRYGTPVTDYQKTLARLCLKSVKKIGVDLKEDTPPYVFDYFTGSDAVDDVVPAPFTYRKDVWGFYNGNNLRGNQSNNPVLPLSKNVNDLIVDELAGACFMNVANAGSNSSTGVANIYYNPKDKSARNGLLRQIIFPTGGTLSWDYEQNWGSFIDNSSGYRMVGGVHVSETASTDGGGSNGCANPIKTLYKFVLDGSTTSSLWGIESARNYIKTSNWYDPEDKYYTWNWKCFPFGCCQFRFTYPGILSRQQAMSLSDIQNFMQAIAPVLTIVSVLTTIMDVVTACTGGSPVALIIDVILGIITTAISCLHDFSKYSESKVYYNMDLNGISPLPTQFKRVEIIENPGTIGKTVHEFSSDAQVPIWELTNPVLSAKQRFAPWAYGLPLRTAVYNAVGKLVKETTNEYNFDENANGCYVHPGMPDTCHKISKVPLNLTSAKCFIRHSSSQRSSYWYSDGIAPSPTSFTKSSNGDIDVDLYDLFSGRVELKKTSEKTFKDGDDTKYVQVETDYTYNSNNYQVSSTHSYQGGQHIYTQLKYNDDFNSGVLATMKSYNIIGVPVSTTISNDAVGERVTEFAITPSGSISPYRTLVQRFAQPGGSFSIYTGPTDPINASKYKITQTSFFDAAGNLAGMKDEGGRAVTNIYGYFDKYIIGAVVNATPLQNNTAYCSFESNPETSDMGGWTSTSNPYIMPTVGFTGSRSYTNGSLSKSVPTGNYTVTLWCINGSTPATVNGQQGVAGVVSGSWKLYTWQLNNVSSIQVTVSGTLMDEVRLFPQTARMRTVAYDPLIGKTAECDENNRVTYYEYDKLGRLQFVKDDNKNILKMYEYNNVSVQNGCPGVYYNHAITERFQKSNCGAGYIGVWVDFTVPANKYSSVLSQDDADVKAEVELLSLGQANADNNSSACIPYWVNDERHYSDTSQCDEGSIGGVVTYSCPAGRYISFVSKADANEMADDDVVANAWTYINSPEHRICTISNDPVWESLEGAQTQCQLVNGEMHLFVLATDVNPNSATYNSTQWMDVGLSDNCPQPTCGSECTSQGPDYACINGQCEQGVRVNLDSYYNGYQWVCIYRYEFSNGTWTDYFMEWNNDPCPL